MAGTSPAMTICIAQGTNSRLSVTELKRISWRDRWLRNVHWKARSRIVTGGVRRLGKGMALAFARDGASVVINARSSRDEAEKAATEVEAAGAKAMVHIADITDEAAVKGWSTPRSPSSAAIDILVNNAADPRRERRSSR